MKTLKFNPSETCPPNDHDFIAVTKTWQHFDPLVSALDERRNISPILNRSMQILCCRKCGSVIDPFFVKEAADEKA